MTAEPEVRMTATDWLRRILVDGPVVSMRVKSLAGQFGIGPKALRNARDRLGVAMVRQGNGEAMRSVWSLPVEGAAAPVQPAADGIRAPSTATKMLRSAKVGVLINVNVSGDLNVPSKPSPMFGFYRNRASPAEGKLLTSANFSAVQTEQFADSALTQFEQARTSHRVKLFVLRGMNEADARPLAFRLVVERDRTNGRSRGSCVECQAFVRNECTVMQPTTVIHECWRRRHDGP